MPSSTGPKRNSAADSARRIAALRPDVVIDLTCYTLESAVQLSNALAGRVQQMIHCGTIWVHGPSVEVPTTEEAPRRPFGEYGCRKAAIERYLLESGRFREIAGDGAPSRSPGRPRLVADHPCRQLQSTRVCRPLAGTAAPPAELRARDAASRARRRRGAGVRTGGGTAGRRNRRKFSRRVARGADVSRLRGRHGRVGTASSRSSSSFRTATGGSGSPSAMPPRRSIICAIRRTAASQKRAPGWVTSRATLRSPQCRNR